MNAYCYCQFTCFEPAVSASHLPHDSHTGGASPKSFGGGTTGAGSGEVTRQ